MHMALPSGALLAAERAYNELPRKHRRDPRRVAETVLAAAAPFMAPAVAQLGRCRINETGAADIFRYWLHGERTSDIATRYAVTSQTINRYVKRGLDRTRARLAGGVPIAVIATENQVPGTAILAALTMEENRHVS